MALINNFAMKKYAIYPGIHTIHDVAASNVTLDTEVTAFHPQGHWTYIHGAFDYAHFYNCEGIKDPDEWLYPIPMPTITLKEELPLTSGSRMIIPDDVVAKVKKRKCKVIFECSAEYFDIVAAKFDKDVRGFLDMLTLEDFSYDLIVNTVTHYGFHKDQVIVLTANKVYESEYFHMCHVNFYEAMFNKVPEGWSLDDYLNKQRALIVNRTKRKKKILTYVGRALPHKLNFIHDIYKNNLRDDNLVTCNYLLRRINYDSFPKEFLKTLPWTNGRVLNDVSDYWWGSEVDEEYYDTYVSCVMESVDDVKWKFVTDDYPNYITEKPMHCIVRMKPFMIRTVAGSLKYMRSLGYETFGDWWDESYNDEKDLTIRREKLFNLFKYVSSMTHEDLADMLYEMLPKLEHNFYTFFENQKKGKHLRNLTPLLQRL